MTWRLTIKAKAHEYVVQHYPLGGNRTAKDNLANAQELICGASFVRDGVEQDVCPLTFASLQTKMCVYRAQRGTWHPQHLLAL